MELTFTFRTVLIKFRVCSVQTGSAYTDHWFIKHKLRNSFSWYTKNLLWAEI